MTLWTYTTLADSATRRDSQSVLGQDLAAWPAPCRGVSGVRNLAAPGSSGGIAPGLGQRHWVGAFSLSLAGATVPTVRGIHLPGG